MRQLLGSCEINNIKCKYHFNGNKFFLIPIEERGIRELNQIFQRGEIKYIELPSSYDEEICDYIYCSEYNYVVGGFSLDVDKYFEYYSNDEVKSIVITSDALNFYVNPAEYFYDLKIEGNYKELDLLYHSKDIHEFNFNFEGVKIISRFMIGGILHRGIASDMKLNSKLELSFEPTNDREFIIRLQDAVKKCFKFAMYNNEIAFNNIELIGNSEKRSKCGCIILPEHKGDVNFKGISVKSNYYYLKDYLGSFFELVANDNNLYPAHLKNTNTEYFNSTETRLANIFAAFESEYRKLPEEVRACDTTSVEPFRNQVLGTLSGIEANNQEEKQFLDQLISRTKELGKVYGSRKKILTAFSYVEDCISSSLKTYGIDQKAINYFSRHIPELRNKIVHNNYEGDVGDQRGISLMEWITYAMLLKRVGIPSNKIEYILGRVFQSNLLGFK
ncbi:hypothetical protein [Priestia megaterium]|uniref:hypothetical protein n=1 Tax=Priestia megaterium TaxID=1404 RepID=UPI00196B6580|nr:hypothetical protein [Priestia megaterium]QSF36954.1 hypothetical protein ICR96_15955 [Priestia megaterium]